jgi:hypothetical protein
LSASVCFSARNHSQAARIYVQFFTLLQKKNRSGFSFSIASGTGAGHILNRRLPLQRIQNMMPKPCESNSY